MNPRWTFRPDRIEHLLKHRVTPIIPNLGVIVLTTSGYVLLIRFPGPYPVTRSPRFPGRAGRMTTSPTRHRARPGPALRRAPETSTRAFRAVLVMAFRA